MKVVTKKSKCEFEDCLLLAVTLACDRTTRYSTPENKTGTIGRYCLIHAEMIAERGCPEYQVSCPNCDCSFGVG